jgi:hypothetical protein
MVLPIKQNGCLTYRRIIHWEIKIIHWEIKEGEDYAFSGLQVFFVFPSFDYISKLQNRNCRIRSIYCQIRFIRLFGTDNY